MILKKSLSESPVLADIVKALKKGQTFCFSGHQNPDADVVGSQLALASLVKRLDSKKKVSIQNSGKPPAYLSFLKGFETIQSVDKVDGKYDVFVSFECSGVDRMGGIIDLKKQAETVINIDHHLHNPNFGEINFVEPKTSSTAELIFKIFQASQVPIQQAEAIAMYTGLTADTGWFRYGNTTTQTHQIASELLKAGIPIADLAERVYMSRSEPSIRLLGWVLSNMTFHSNNKIAVITLTQSKLDEFGATSDDLEEVVNHGLLNANTVISALVKEKTPGSLVKVSLRSKGNWDINQVARKFGGGGHRNASGCQIKKSLPDAESSILAEIKKVVEK